MYGHLALWLGVSWLSGSVFSRRTMRLSHRQREVLAYGIAIMGGLSMLGLALLNVMTLWSIFIPACIVVFGVSILFSK